MKENSPTVFIKSLYLKFHSFYHSINIEKYHDISFLLIILIIGGIIRIRGLISFNFPMTIPYNGGGLYYAFIQAIIAHQFNYPAYIPNFTADGLPFVYPPLCFYVLAVISIFFHLDPLTLINYSPTIISIINIGLFFLLSKELFAEKKLIYFSSLLFAISPVVIYPKFFTSGSELIHAAGLTLLLLGILFQIRSRKKQKLLDYLFFGIILGLTIITSPAAAFLLIILYLIDTIIHLTTTKNRLKEILFAFLIAFSISLFWLINVYTNHGIGFIVSGFLFKQDTSILWFFIKSAAKLSVLNGFSPFYPPWFLVILIGLGYCLLQKEWFYPFWFLCWLFSPESYYYLFIPAIFLITICLLKFIIPNLVDNARIELNKALLINIVSFILLSMVILHPIALGEINSYKSGGDPTKSLSHIQKEQLDFDAMNWIAENTPEDSIFIAKDILYTTIEEGWMYGDWFPAISKRTTLNVHFGSEWTGEFEKLWEIDEQIHQISVSEELIEFSDENDFNFTHIYVHNTPVNQQILSNLRESNSFTLIYANEYVNIYKFDRYDGTCTYNSNTDAPKYFP